MPPSYQDPVAGREYANFSASRDGQQQHKLISLALRPLLPHSPATVILDAGCGDGWLTGELVKNYKSVAGCDISKELVSIAKKNNPLVLFEVADIAISVPFKLESFDVIVASLVLHNIQDQVQALRNLYAVLKPHGKLLIVSVNPYYAYPTGVWKRGLLGRLFNKKPKLKLRPYFELVSAEREHVWRGLHIPLRFSPLPEQLNNALATGFNLLSMQDLKSPPQNEVYDFNYRCSRFPMLVLLELQKN